RAGAVAARCFAHLPVSAWGSEHHRYLGHEAERATGISRRVRSNPDQRQRRAGLRALAAFGPAHGQILTDSLVSAPQLRSRRVRSLHVHRLLSGRGVQSDAVTEQSEAGAGFGHRAETRAPRWRAAVRLLAEAASERRAGVPRIDGRA